MSFNTGSFARARAMMAAISALLAQGLKGFELQQQINALGPYRSRGKGRGKAFDRQRHGNSTGKTYPMNGAREVARRQRQIAAGILRTN